MKKYIFIIILLISVVTQAKAGDSVIESIADMDGVTSVYITKDMLKTFGSQNCFNLSGVEITDVVQNLESMVVISCDRHSNLEKIKQKLKVYDSDKEYSLIMKIKSDDSIVKTFVRESSSGFKNFVMITIENLEIVIINLNGTFKIEDLKKITAYNMF